MQSGNKVLKGRLYYAVMLSLQSDSCKFLFRSYVIRVTLLFSLFIFFNVQLIVFFFFLYDDEILDRKLQKPASEKNCKLPNSDSSI